MSSWMNPNWSEWGKNYNSNFTKSNVEIEVHLDKIILKQQKMHIAWHASVLWEQLIVLYLCEYVCVCVCVCVFVCVCVCVCEWVCRENERECSNHRHVNGSKHMCMFMHKSITIFLPFSLLLELCFSYFSFDLNCFNQKTTFILFNFKLFWTCLLITQKTLQIRVWANTSL